MVIKESLRLRPPTLLVSPRVTTEETDLGGFKVPANTEITPNIAAIMRDPNYWQDPDEFWPERWEQQIPAELYLPFFCGPRIW